MPGEPAPAVPIRSFRKRIIPFMHENGRIVFQSVFTVFFFALGFWFIRHERTELADVKQALGAAHWAWVLAGIAITVFYIFLQGQMYVFSFASVRKRISLFNATVLFVKRNLVSVFLPAGGVSSLAFFTGSVEKTGIRKSQIHFASSIYGFVGILSVIVVAVPLFIFAVIRGSVGEAEWVALGALILLAGGAVLIYRSLVGHGWVYRVTVRFIPAATVLLNDLRESRIDRKSILLTILASVLIEFTGIAQLYVAMKAIGIPPSLYAAALGYIISVIFMVVSPFLRGLGAIEVSMAFVLIRLGFDNVTAISITLLYRFFEFWLPLLAGVLSFLSRLNRLLMRVLPAIFLMMLGIINIVSVFTPAIAGRLSQLKEFLPVEVIHASNYLVLAAGLFLMVTAAFMLKGLRMAWLFALALSILSFIGHLTKAIDYEEAIAALAVVAILLATYREYRIRTNPRLRIVGLQTSLLLTLAVLVYGTVGFYFLDKKHFNTDFSLVQSIRLTLANYLMIGSDPFVPADAFARYFLKSINISGICSVTFLVYTLIRPYVARKIVPDEDRERAGELVASSGRSSMDYFKTYRDKMIFLSESRNAFIAYRIAGDYAVVLEDPVAESREEMKQCIVQAGRYFYQNGLKSIFYRVPEESLPTYRELRWKSMFIGQEAVVPLDTFSLEGGSMRAIRNAINKVTKSGYHSRLHEPPVPDGILQKIKAVSDEWLHDMGRKEIVFSQGMFVWEELKEQSILTVENPEERIVAFLNLIPDRVSGEVTYDLFRKTADAPNGVMDFLLVEFFHHAKAAGFSKVDIGFAPMGGIDDPHTFPERSMKFAYERIKSFSHFRGSREYKNKFVPSWQNRFLVYQNDYDLLQVPSVLGKVIKP